MNIASAPVFLFSNPLSIAFSKYLKEVSALFCVKRLICFAINFPCYLPSFTLNSYFIKVFNFLFYVKNISKVRTSFIHYDPYFYPLDKINNWNRIYGKKGFIQYQFVLPKEKSYEGISKNRRERKACKCSNENLDKNILICKKIKTSISTGDFNHIEKNSVNFSAANARNGLR